MGCATSLVKYVVFIFNFLFLLAAIAFIVCGVLVKLGIDDVVTPLDGLGIPLSVIPIIMIVVGCIVFVIAFFGCCGAIKESTCMLTTYAVILIVLLIAQVAVGIYAFIQIKDSDDFSIGKVENAFKNIIIEYNKGTETIVEAVDAIQSESKCCGGKEPADWGNSIPGSCCGKPHGQTCVTSESYSNGCGKEIFEFLQNSIKIIGIVIITIAGVELVGAIVALCLSSSIRNNERRGHYA